ncbi:MAG: DUF2894 domain-containing protein, partial [Oleiphilaceae bacterium]|nr:DUF2894 domain-containing protein [Oleiphilaceae bacterium]
MTEAHIAASREALQALALQGGRQIDPITFTYLESMLKRMAGQREVVAQKLEHKLRVGLQQLEA